LSPEDLFQQLIVPELAGGYNVARWLLGSAADAEDAMQEASLRAFRALGSVHARNARAWFLQIVRNCSYTILRKRGARLLEDSEEVDIADPQGDPASQLSRAIGLAELRRAIEALPPEFREAVVLRELEELSYKEIAEICEIPEGTVMSRLSRARKLLKESLGGKEN
jgi:RNA polymerase sigma-70 factor (ECF subfamily)